MCVSLWSTMTSSTDARISVIEEESVNPVGMNTLVKKKRSQILQYAAARSSSRRFAGALFGDTPLQSHENDRATLVLVHRPGVEALFGSIHAQGSLFEHPLNLEKARRDHNHFVRVLRRRGIRVIRVRDVLIDGCDIDMTKRVELENFATNIIDYRLQCQSEGRLSRQQIRLMSNDYKKRCLESMSPGDIADLILLGPDVELAPSDINTPLTVKQLTLQPLMNMCFMRDQQIVTRRGVVIANLASDQRVAETMIMNFVFEKLGIPVLGMIEEPGTLEGGDFFPLGEDLCLIGVGLRTNDDACLQLMENGWLGTRRIALVDDLYDQDQQRMHLDTVFNILSHDCCIMLDTIIGPDSPQRRMVREFVRKPDGTYVLAREGIEFSQYIREEGFRIIPLTEEDQAAYGLNVLNTGKGDVISTNPVAARKIIESGIFHGKMEVIDFSGMQTMYGSVHCCSQCLRVPMDIAARTHTVASRSDIFDGDNEEEEEEGSEEERGSSRSRYRRKQSGTRNAIGSGIDPLHPHLNRGLPRTETSIAKPSSIHPSSLRSTLTPFHAKL